MSPTSRIRIFVNKKTRDKLKKDNGDYKDTVEEVVQEFFRLVKGEFQGKFWRSPSGAKIKWPPRRAKGSHPLMIKTGRLLRGATGQSGESQHSVAKQSFKVEIRVPYAYKHRGGTGTNPTGRFGALPPRRFATGNPEIRKFFAKKMKKAMLDRFNE